METIVKLTAVPLPTLAAGAAGAAAGFLPPNNITILAGLVAPAQKMNKRCSFLQGWNKIECFFLPGALKAKAQAIKRAKKATMVFILISKLMLICVSLMANRLKIKIFDDSSKSARVLNWKNQPFFRMYFFRATSIDFNI